MHTWAEFEREISGLSMFLSVQTEPTLFSSLLRHASLTIMGHVMFSRGLYLLALGAALVACGQPEPTVTPATPTRTATTAPLSTSAPTENPGPAPTLLAADPPMPTLVQAANSVPTPTPEVGVVAEDDVGPLLQPNNVALFGRISGEYTRDSLRTVTPLGQVIHIPLESSSHALVMVSVLPARGEPIVLETFTSPGYARNVASPSTVDDQLFIVRRFDGGNTDFSEYDLKTRRAFPSTAVAHSTGAVVGDTGYSYKIIQYDQVLFLNPSLPRLEFIREPLHGGEASRTTVRDVGSYRDDLYFPIKLMSAGQNLYGLKEPSSSDPAIRILRVDQSTGEPTEIVGFEVDDFNARRLNWVWSVDNGVVYWAMVKDSTNLEVWRYELERSSPPQVASVTLPQSSAGILQFDVDDGIVVIGILWEGDAVCCTKFVLFDVNIPWADVIDLGLRISDVQVIHLGE